MRSLGNTGIVLNGFGMGGIPLQRLSQDEAQNVIDTFYNCGGRFIDTARGYGESENLIGQALTRYHREAFIIATKSPAKDYQTMKKDIQTSLHCLKTDYIDVYQCHLVKTRAEYNQIFSDNGAYRALTEAKEAGQIKHIGITAHSADLLNEVIDFTPFETIQFPYNCVERQGEPLFEKAKQRNIGVIVMKPLAGGAIESYDLSLRFVMNNPNVSIVIPGMDNSDQVFKNAEVLMHMRPLDAEEHGILARLSEKLGNKFCRRCGYCLPCPQGIDIPSQFLIEGYLTRYGLREWANMRYNSLSVHADACIECGQCEPKCPYNLPIIAMLKNVTEKFK